MSVAGMHGDAVDAVRDDAALAVLDDDGETLLYAGDRAGDKTYLLERQGTTGDRVTYALRPIDVEPRNVSGAIARNNAAEGTDVPLTLDNMTQDELVATGDTYTVTSSDMYAEDESPMVVARDIVSVYKSSGRGRDVSRHLPAEGYEVYATTPEGHEL